MSLGPLKEAIQLPQLRRWPFAVTERVPVTERVAAIERLAAIEPFTADGGGAVLDSRSPPVAWAM